MGDLTGTAADLSTTGGWIVDRDALSIADLPAHRATIGGKQGIRWTEQRATSKEHEERCEEVPSRARGHGHCAAAFSTQSGGVEGENASTATAVIPPLVPVHRLLLVLAPDGSNSTMVRSEGSTASESDQASP